jgi:hypothetical protein
VETRRGLPAFALDAANHGDLDDAPHFYDSFARRADGVIKAILRPN